MTDTLTGWRFWDILPTGQLLPPLAQVSLSSPLPRDGVIEATCKTCADPPTLGHACGIHFTPTRKALDGDWHGRGAWVARALTFGTAYRVLPDNDPTMWRWQSARCARYEARYILTEHVDIVRANYDMPVRQE